MVELAGAVAVAAALGAELVVELVAEQDAALGGEWVAASPGFPCQARPSQIPTP
ncbi:hypothetical protein [Humidesulfovibrio mexicanus]|uniref:hypothetical protein n=1 Tax=Humidesulfovibrio mexicanus TaxID=147047 RepID=UPI0015C5F247|nr:hypothetical protein [Humidesulfovibrio mexicanus]